MTWNDTLAAYALKDAKTCVYGHTWVVPTTWRFALNDHWVQSRTVWREHVGLTRIFDEMITDVMLAARRVSVVIMTSLPGSSPGPTSRVCLLL